MKAVYNIHTIEGQRRLEHDGFIIGTALNIGAALMVLQGSLGTGINFAALGVTISVLSHLNYNLREKVEFSSTPGDSSGK